MLKIYQILIGCLLIFMLAISPSDAQKKKKGKKGQVTERPEEKEDKKEEEEKETIDDKVKKHAKFDGLFIIYQDSTSGKIKMEIREDQLDKDFIYFGQVKDGPTEAFLFRGAYDNSTIFTIKKYFDRIEFVKRNTASYFDKGSALKNASDANITDAIMVSEKIIAEDKEKGKYLIEADNLFLKETFTLIKTPPFPSLPKNRFKLGSNSKDKTKILSIQAYPENLDLAIEYVYDNPLPTNFGSRAVTDARYVNISIYYSLIEVPENGYQPRYDDARVGYFLTQTTDQTSISPTPYRDMIHRWNLEKKDPSAAISEPKEPITWWMENTTPVEWRATIKEGVLQWNKAFEKAGFRNAIVVKQQPDDANWDAGDIRYNVLRWTSSPNPPFGGYGPSFVNPLTGQILGADIMLEFVYHTNRVKYDNIYNFEPSAYDDSQMMGLAFANENHKYCNYGQMMQNNTLFGQTALVIEEAPSMEMEGLKKEAMLELIMHEVGHTLGLNHNMKASQLWSKEDLANPEKIAGKSLSGSVMDYLLINVTRDRSKQGQYYSPTVGPYDVWAIEYGYSQFKNDAEMKSLLDRSTEPELIFGNDADDMRSPGKAIDPRVNTGDLSNDQIGYSIDRFEVVRSLMGGVKERFTKEGQSFHEMRQAFLILSGQYFQAGNVISRFIGGVYVDRAMAKQGGASQPYTPVAYAEQKRAMNVLNKYMFATDAWQAPNDIYNYLAIQRRGFNFFSTPEDPKIHSMVLRAQRNVLRHLLHWNTQQRMVDSQLYGNKYSISEMMTDLNNGIFRADIRGNVNSFRQNLQIEYTKMLGDILTGSNNSKYSNQAKSMAIFNLKQINLWGSVSGGNTSTKAHKEHLKLLVNKALDED